MAETTEEPTLRSLLLAASAERESDRSITRLAERLGVSQQTIHRNWLRPNRLPVQQYSRVIEIAEGRICEQALLKFVLNNR